MNFGRTNKVKGIAISKKFIRNISIILKNSYYIYHSHITGDIFEYSHTFCNEKVRENYYKIPVVAHTKDTVIGEKNPTNIDFAHISNQVQFINTIKYFQ